MNAESQMANLANCNIKLLSRIRWFCFKLFANFLNTNCCHLFVDCHHLVSGENERVVVASSFATVQGQDGDGPVPLDLDRVPLAVVDEYCGKPNLFLFGS